MYGCNHWNDKHAIILIYVSNSVITVIIIIVINIVQNNISDPVIEVYRPILIFNITKSENATP